ncbi:MAG: peroxide stress protein YaaA [Alphaproteobacteria bacterium]
MLALVSPAKKLDFETPWNCEEVSQSDFLDDTQELVNTAKTLPKDRLQSLMKLSDKLGELNYARYQNFSLPFAPDNAKPAVYTFRGDTYVGLDADTLSDDDMAFAQTHFRMLSGLYGMLRPLDLMQPYRLEMGTKLSNQRGEDLYDFWGDILTRACNDITQGHKDRSVISLASNEYIKSIQPKALDGAFITCHFKEIKNGAPKVIGLFAKRARGAMARYMIQNRIEKPEGLKSFDTDGYVFQDDLSDATNYVFIRNQES